MTNREFVKRLVDSDKSYPNQILSHNSRQIITCINPYSYLIFRKKRDLYDQFDKIYVDGILLCIFIRLLWGKKIRRLSFDMVGIARDLFEYLDKSGNTLYLIGAKQKELEKTIRVFSKSYPNMKIIGYRNGYFTNKEEWNLSISKIIEIAPDYVIVGMGTPLQDQYALDLKRKGYKGIVFTCGGFLRQTSNGIKYYPDWVNKYNLRGFYRQFNENGIVKRNYHTFILFPFYFIVDSIKSLIKWK